MAALWCAKALTPNYPLSVIFISPLQQPGAFVPPCQPAFSKLSENTSYGIAETQRSMRAQSEGSIPTKDKLLRKVFGLRAWFSMPVHGLQDPPRYPRSVASCAHHHRIRCHRSECYACREFTVPRQYSFRAKTASAVG